MSPVNRNIEIKARLPNAARVRSRVTKLPATLASVEHQRDTYFHARDGRLKLRERWIHDAGPPEPRPAPSPPERACTCAELVWYHRNDVAGQRTSAYTRMPAPDPDHLRRILAGAVGVRVCVEKLRVVYLYDNVRIHLDDVRDLGEFLEFEAVLDDAYDEASSRRTLRHLCASLEIAGDDTIAGSYADMIEAQLAHAPMTPAREG
jgi:adenylate cyclase class IV